MPDSPIDVLTASESWSSTPDDYNSLRYLQFQKDGTGIVVYGYGQMIFAEIEFIFAINGDSLTITYLESSPSEYIPVFSPDEETREKTIQFTLESGDYVFNDGYTKCRFTSKLSLSDSPYPVGLEFQFSVPTEFFGFCEEIEIPLSKRDRSKAASIVNDVLCERVNLRDVASQLVAIGKCSRGADSQLFAPFESFLSDIIEFPVGDDRKHWNQTVLARKDDELRSTEKRTLLEAKAHLETIAAWNTGVEKKWWQFWN